MSPLCAKLIPPFLLKRVVGDWMGGACQKGLPLGGEDRQRGPRQGTRTQGGDRNEHRKERV
jgi:hypothetical protein